MEMDSITKLRDIAFQLLDLYKEAQTAVIWEYSGQITQDLEELERREGKYAAQINELYKEIVDSDAIAALDGDTE